MYRGHWTDAARHPALFIKGFRDGNVYNSTAPGFSMGQTVRHDLESWNMHRDRRESGLIEMLAALALPVAALLMLAAGMGLALLMNG
jgi:hypothetical protein